MRATAVQAGATGFAVSINPAAGQEIRRTPILDAHGVERIVASVESAFRDWRTAGRAQRSTALERLGKQIDGNAAALAREISLEMGKPISAARAEVAKCAALCQWYAANLEELLADEVPDLGGDGKASISYRPLGIVLGVMPWNFPAWQVLRAAVPIMAAGNGFLLKHADNVQGCAALLADIFAAAGLDAFASLNISRHSVAGLIADPRIAGVTVTAGVAAGSAIAAEAGRNLKKSLLELGGSDPFIVLGDAELDRAAEAAVAARFQNSGQVCIAAKRIIVERSIADPFIDRFVGAARALKVGDPLDEHTQLGPLARSRVRDELHSQVEHSLASGATRLLGGDLPDGPGSYYPATVLTNITREMPVFKEETFGPVAAIIVAEDAADAVRIANDSCFGLSAALWSADLDRAETLAAAIETGAVFINGISASDPRVPIGGVKSSGYGRELSHFGLREFCNAQLRWTRA